MSGSKSTSENQSSNSASSFVDPSQSPFLEFLRSQGMNLAQGQLGEGSGYQQNIQGQQDALQGMLTPQQNPFLQGQIEQGQFAINENLQQNILPGIGSNAQLAGQFGGGRQGVAEGIAMRDANRTGADFAQNLIGQDYQNQQQRAIQALALAPSINQGGFSPLMNFGSILGGPNNLTQAQGSSSGESNSKSLGF